MKVNKYYLTYRFLNASVHAMIMRDEVEVYSIDLCRMLKISTEKPWKLQKIEYDLFEMNEDNGMLTLCLQSGVMTVKLTLFINNDGLLEFEAEWENTSDEDIANVMLGVEIPMKLADADRIVIPGVCYDDGINENGILKSSVMGSRGYIAEEHKYPMPFVSIQNYKKSGDNSIALFSCPSKCQANEEFDSEWSLGVTTHGDDIKLVLLSGGVMYQGEKNTMLCAKDTAHKSDRGYFVFKSTQKVSKRFMLSVFHAEKENTTLGRLAGTGYYIYEPSNTKKITNDAFISYKHEALVNRYTEENGVVGYLKQLEMCDDGEKETYGSPSKQWTVENILAAWCDASTSLSTRSRDGIERARKCIDFYIEGSHSKKRGLRQLFYNVTDNTWSGSAQSSVIPSGEFGRMLTYLAETILLFKEHYLEVPEKWLEALNESCEFLCKARKMTRLGLYPQYWNNDGSIDSSDKCADGIPCVGALAVAYMITGNHRYINTAQKLFSKYYDNIILKYGFIAPKKKRIEENIPYCDKKTEMAFLIAAEYCYEATHDEKYIKMAVPSAERLISYVNMCNYPLRSDSRLAKEGLDMRGLSFAGMQRFALCTEFPSYEMKIVGQMTDNKLLTRTAEMTVNAVMGVVSTGKGEYGTDKVGENPKLFYTSNWTTDSLSASRRGGYANMNSLGSLTWSYRQVLKMSLKNVYASITSADGRENVE